MDINMITRDQWGALPPKGMIPEFDNPGLHVVLTLKTAFDKCTTKEDCMQKVKAMQKLHMEDWGLPDIAYNFIMGDDGNVYEGRGWNYRPAKAIGNAKFASRTYDIGLIGDYKTKALLPVTIHDVAEKLIQFGIKKNFMWCDYTLEGSVDLDEPTDPKTKPKDYK